jgi:dCMP deaminase
MTTWHRYFMDMAHKAASRSKDPNTKVGCIVTSQDKVVVASGYNGIPQGVKDLPERMERPAKYLWTAHAEENAVALAARVGASLRDGSAYVTHHPCSRCARTLIQAGIKVVYVDRGVTNMPKEEFDVALQMFIEAGVYIVDMQRSDDED